MNVIMDACSVINLHNAGLLSTVCAIEGITVQIGPIAGGECSEDCALELATLHDDDDLVYLSDTELDSEVFLEFVNANKLGDGEAECILLASEDANAVVCCDDMRGRKKAIDLLGEERLMGSIRLLKIAVESGVIAPHEAFAGYERMRVAGGFLPDIDQEYFEDS